MYEVMFFFFFNVDYVIVVGDYGLGFGFVCFEQFDYVGQIYCDVVVVCDFVGVEGVYGELCVGFVDGFGGYYVYCFVYVYGFGL